MKHKNIKKERFIFSGQFIFAIQTIISVLTMLAVVKLNLLPTLYFSAVLGALVFLLLLTVNLTINKKKKKQGFLKVLSLLISLVLVVVTFNVYNGESFISGITGASKDTHIISVVVMDESEYKEFDDVKDFTFGANTVLDQESMDKALELISTKYKSDINIENEGDYVKLANDLYNGNYQVILLSESHRTFITDNIEDFNERTRVIGEVSYQVETELQDLDTDVKNDTFSIFLSGIDTYGPVSSASRSDVNMVVTINPNTNQILLTSIPRDYHVVLPKFGKKDKLTHAGIYGATESVRTLELLLGVDIDFYAKVNFSSVTKIVDALGGVTVNSQWAFRGPGGYQFNVGENFLDGAKALSFVRERYSLPGGDNSRVINQQALVTGILNKSMSPAIISNFNSILSAIDGSFEMSIPTADFKSLIKTQADTMKSWEIIQIQLSGIGSHSTTTASMPGWNLYVMEPNMESVNKASGLIQAMENNLVISE